MNVFFISVLRFEYGAVPSLEGGFTKTVSTC